MPVQVQHSKAPEPAGVAQRPEAPARRSPRPSRSRRRFRLLAALARDRVSFGMTAMPVAVLALVGSGLDHRWQVVGYYLAQGWLDVLIPLTAFALAAASTGSGRRLWRGVGIGCFCYLASDVVRLVAALSSADARHVFRSDPSWLLDLAANVLIVGSMLLHPTGATGVRARLRFWLDIGAVVAGASVVAWCVLIGPGTGSFDPDRLLPVISASVLACLQVLVILKLVLSERPPATRTTGTWCLISTAAAFGVQSLGLDRADGAPVPVGLLGAAVAAYTLGIGLRCQLLQVRADPGLLTRSRTRQVSVLPYLTMITMLVVLVLVLPDGLGAGAVTALVGVMATSVLLICRQVMTFGENADLIHRLDASLLALGGQQQRLSSLLEHSSDITVTVAADGRVAYVSPAAERILGLAPAGLVNQPWDTRFHPDDLPAARAALGALPGGASATFQARVRHADGGWHWLEIICTDLTADPVVKAIVCNAREVTETRRLHDRLRHAASHDALTELANRALFAERIEACTGGPGDSDAPVAVLVVDLDGFKKINDTYGHHAGDTVLTTVAGRLRSCVRGCDTAARLGGDEFAVLLPGASGTEAGEVAERFLASLDEPVRLDCGVVRARASVGVAAGRSSRITELLREADAAMYRAKAGGDHRATRRPG